MSDHVTLLWPLWTRILTKKRTALLIISFDSHSSQVKIRRLSVEICYGTNMVKVSCWPVSHCDFVCLVFPPNFSFDLTTSSPTAVNDSAHIWSAECFVLFICRLLRVKEKPVSRNKDGSLISSTAFAVNTQLTDSLQATSEDLQPPHTANISNTRHAFRSSVKA